MISPDSVPCLVSVHSIFVTVLARFLMLAYLLSLSYSETTEG